MLRPVHQGHEASPDSVPRPSAQDLYSHVIPGMQEDAAAMVDAALKAAAEKLEANGSKKDR